MPDSPKDMDSDDDVGHLEDFFSEKPSASALAEKNKAPSPLNDMKAVILAIDWEINDEIMTELIEETGRLKEVFKHDKIITLFLQLLGSVGKYIKTKKVNAHPDAIKLLNSVYTNLERAVVSPDISDDSKKKMLLLEVEKFNRLKSLIAEQKADTIHKDKESPEGLKAEDVSQMSPQQVLAYALEEIKKVIRAEFRALREELKG